MMKNQAPAFMPSPGISKSASNEENQSMNLPMPPSHMMIPQVLDPTNP